VSFRLTTATVHELELATFGGGAAGLQAAPASHVAVASSGGSPESRGGDVASSKVPASIGGVLASGEAQPPVAQVAGGTHCVSPVQDVGHTPLAQTNGAQVTEGPVPHAPAPSHVRRAAPLPTQIAPQNVPACAVALHAPAPSHIPSAPHGSAGFVEQLSWCGFM
jgi:hypothetical protein